MSQRPTSSRGLGLVVAGSVILALLLLVTGAAMLCFVLSVLELGDAGAASSR